MDKCKQGQAYNLMLNQDFWWQNGFMYPEEFPRILSESELLITQLNRPEFDILRTMYEEFHAMLLMK